VVEDEDHLT
jgi:hypothetical protein